MYFLLNKYVPLKVQYIFKIFETTFFLNVTKCDNHSCCGVWFFCLFVFLFCWLFFPEKLLDHKAYINLDDRCE